MNNINKNSLKLLLHTLFLTSSFGYCMEKEKPNLKELIFNAYICEGLPQGREIIDNFIQADKQKSLSLFVSVFQHPINTAHSSRRQALYQAFQSHMKEHDTQTFKGSREISDDIYCAIDSCDDGNTLYSFTALYSKEDIHNLKSLHTLA